MFDELKNLNKFRQQASDLQAKLAEEQVIGKSRDGRFSVTMNGNQEILEVYVPEHELIKIEIEEGIKDAFHNARAKVEALIKSKMIGSM